MSAAEPHAQRSAPAPDHKEFLEQHVAAGFDKLSLSSPLFLRPPFCFALSSRALPCCGRPWYVLAPWERSPTGFVPARASEAERTTALGAVGAWSAEGTLSPFSPRVSSLGELLSSSALVRFCCSSIRPDRMVVAKAGGDPAVEQQRLLEAQNVAPVHRR